MGLSSTSALAEVEMPGEDFALLEQFERHTLSQADKTFKEKQYRQAASEYEAFLRQFPRSPAVPYAILRKARSLDLDNKRHEAIRIYTEVLDFFPDDIKYAAPALYHIGRAHWDNGDVVDAMKAWAEMADDIDYSKHPLAAGAIYKLGEELWKQDKHDRAIKFFEQVAIDFRGSNEGVARNAIGKVVPYYVRHDPNEDKLREFYVATRSFHHRPQKIAEDLSEDWTYWNTVRNLVKQHGSFTDLQRDHKERYYRYWADTLDGKFPKNDELQIDLANFKLAYEGNRDAWMKRLDEQFEAYQKDGDSSRIVRWVEVYSNFPEKAKEYYNKLDFAKMPNAQIIELFKTIWEKLEDEAWAKSAFEKIRLTADDMDDSKRHHLARWLWHRRADELIERVYASYEDRENGQYQLLDYYHWRRNQKEGVPLAEQLTNVPRFAKGAWKMKGDLHYWANDWDQAMAAYRAWDNPPDSIFSQASVYRQQKKFGPAIATLSEVESMFSDPKKYGDAAPRAAYQAAQWYKEAGEMDKYIAKLRRLMGQYPKSRQSSSAHQELERLGVKLGGAVDAE